MKRIKKDYSVKKNSNNIVINKRSLDKRKKKKKKKSNYYTRIINNIYYICLKFSHKKLFINGLENFSKALNNNPNNDELLYCKALCLYYLDKTVEAKNCINKAIKLKKDENGYLELKEYILKWKPENCKFSKFSKKYNILTTNERKPKEILIKKCIDNISSQKHDECIQIIEKEIKINHNKFVDFFNEVGYIYDELKDTETAIKYYEKSIKINPKHYHSYINLIICLNKIKKSEEALKYITKTNQKFPENKDCELLFQKGITLQNLEKYDDAVTSYNKSLELKPDAQSYNNIGVCCYNLDDFNKAIENYEKALELDKKNFNFYMFNIAESTYKIGDHQKAKNMYLDLLKSNNLDEDLKSEINLLLNKINSGDSSINFIKTYNNIKTIDSKKYLIFPISNETKIIDNIENINHISETISITSNQLLENFDGIEFFNKKLKSKEIKLENMNNSSEIDQFLSMFNKLSQENIICYYQYKFTENILTIIKEDGYFETLKNILSKEIKISIQDKIKIALDCAKGLWYLHYNHIIHGNLKSKNVMTLRILKSNNEIHFTAKLSNYGFSHILEKIALVDSDSKNLKNFRSRAPEYFKNSPIDMKTDIYSLGILLWEIFSQKVPFYEQALSPMKLICKIAYEKLRPDISQLDSETPSSVIELIIKCWDDDKNIRPTSKEVAVLLNSLLKKN